MEIKMNERIRLLAEQARAWVNDPDNVAPLTAYIFYKDMYDKKFAELIVKECADLCDRYQEIPATEPRHCANDIRSMFGVEE